MRKFLSVFAAVSLISIFCSSIGIAQEGGVSGIDLPTLKKQLAENKGKVVVVNFWSPF